MWSICIVGTRKGIEMKPNFLYCFRIFLLTICRVVTRNENNDWRKPVEVTLIKTFGMERITQPCRHIDRQTDMPQSSQNAVKLICPKHIWCLRGHSCEMLYSF